MGRKAMSIRQCLVHVLQKVPDQYAVGLSSVTRGQGSHPGPASSRPATAWVARRRRRCWPGRLAPAAAASLLQSPPALLASRAPCRAVDP
eukprot:8001209-Pyramimonas_sp.AAC.1